MKLRTVLFFLVISFNLFAVDKTWLGTSASMNDPSNWSPSGVPIANDNLIFPAAATVKNITNDIPGNLFVGNMTFSAGYTVTGNSISISATPPKTLSFTTAGTSLFLQASSPGVTLDGSWAVTSVASPGNTLNSVIKGGTQATLSLASGQLNLSQVNQFEGTISVGTASTPATLQAGATGAFGSASYQPIFSLLGTSTLDLNNFNATVSSLAGSQDSTVSLGSGTLTITESAILGNLSGNIGSNIILDPKSSLTINRNPSSGIGDINSVIQGGTDATFSLSSGFVKLSQVNQFEGITSVGTISTPATLQAGITGALGSTTYKPVLNVLGTSTLDLNSFDATVSSLSGTQGSTVSLGSGTLTITDASQDIPFYGTLSGTGSLTIPSGTLALMGSNTYSGITTIESGGALNVLQGLGSTSKVVIQNGAGTVVFGQALTSSTDIEINGPTVIGINEYDVTISGELSGSDVWQKIGRGTLTLTNTNSSLAGQLKLSGGVLNVTTNSLGTPSSILFDSFGGTLQIAENMSIDKNIILSNLGAFDTNGFDLTLSQPITGSNPLIKKGAGTLTLTSTGNNYAAKTYINEGTLSVTPQTFSSGSQQIVFNKPGTGVFQITDAFPSFTRSIVLFADGTVDTNTHDMTASGVIAGLATNAFKKAGAGTLTLTGQNIYKGATQVNAGTLQAGIASTSTYGALGLDSAVTVASGATLDFQTYSNKVGSLDNSGTVNSSATIETTSYTQDSAATLELNFPTTQASPLGNISGTGAINLDGTLTVTNTGGFNLTSGEVILLQSSGAGKQLAGTFSSTTLPFGKLKYDYSLNQVILGIGGCDGIWSSTSNGNWGTTGNWSSGCVPGISGQADNQDSATFNDVSAGAVTVTLATDPGTAPQPVTLHDITLGAPSTSYTITQFSSASTITLDGPTGSSKPTIHLTAGTATIDAPIVLNKDSALSLSTGTLTLGSNTAITSTSTQNLLISEGQTTGILTNQGSITPASLTIEGNTVNNHGMIQTSGAIVIDDLPGVHNPITVNNFSTFTAGTTLNITDNATIDNQGTMNSVGNFTISNGMVTNQSAAQLYAGTGSVLEIAGGTVTNDQGGMLGALDANLTLSGGTLNSSDQIKANNYSQSSSATLGLDFPTTSSSPAGNVLAAAGISLDGTLNVTNTGGFNPTVGTEIILMQSTASGKQLSGTFSSTSLYFGKLKYDYKHNEVILGIGGCDGIWTSTSNGNWGTTGNWSSGCVPGINLQPDDQDSATFNDVAAAAITVTLATDPGTAALPIMLHDMNFSAPNTTYTIQQFSSASTITLDGPAGSSKPTIHLTAGAATIDAPIVLNKDSMLSLSSGTLTLATTGSLTSTGSNLLIVEGHTTGTLTNLGSLTPASLTIEGNTINNHGTIETTDAIVIDDLPGVHNPITINNYSTFKAGTTLNITDNSIINNQGTMHSVGNLTISNGTISNQSGGQLYAGPSSILEISGGKVTNSQSATLGASNADLTLSGGTLTSSGQVLANNYKQSNSATLALNLINSTNFGNIAANGQASLGGNLIVNASADVSLSANQSFDLITAQGGVANEFSNVSFQSFPASVIPNLSYLSNSVRLNTSPAVPTHFSGNSHIVFSMIKQHNSYITRKCFQLKRQIPGIKYPNNNQQLAKIDLSDPQTKGTIASLNLPSDLAQSINTVTDSSNENNSDTQRTSPTLVVEKPGKVYFGPIGSVGRVNTKGDQIGSTYSSVGGLIGCDYLFQNIEKLAFDVGIGGIIQYRKQWGDGKKNSGDFHSDILHGSLYSTFIPKQLSELSLEAVLGFAYIWDHLNRKTGFDNKETAKSSPDQNVFDALAGAEYTFTLPKNFSFTPFLYLQYVRNHIDGFKETGAGIYNLSSKSQTIHSLNTQLGARTCYTIVRPKHTLTFEFDAEWLREYLNDDRSVGFTPFVITTQPTSVTASSPSKNSLLLALEAILRFSNGWQTEASYSFQYNSSFCDHFFYLGVGKQF